MKRIGIVAIVVVTIAVIFGMMNVVFLGGAYAPSDGRQNTSSSLDGYSYNAEEPAVGGGLAPLPDEMAGRSADFDFAAQDSIGNVPQQQERLVIKNADLTIVVKDPVVKMQDIATMTTSMGGFVVSSTTGEAYLSDGTKVPEGSIVLRIPADKLDAALEEIKGNVVEVRRENQSGQDVTKEYTDLNSQLKNLRDTEKKLAEIMEKATETEDVLAVFNQLTQIRGQIELIIGQMQYYEQSAAMSMVTVRLIAEETIQPIEIAGWEPQGEARDALQALIDFFQNFVDFLIWLVIFFIPVALVILLLIFLIWRLVRWAWRKFSKKNAEPVG